MKYVSALSQLLLFSLALVFSFYTLQPSIIPPTSETDFSVDNAMLHVEEIAKKPHYTGSDAHAIVRNYIISSLENLGLKPHLQQDFSTTYSYGLSIAVPENIIAKIDGKNPENPALVIMSHYDSNPHSSYGAADAASGVAAILESVRAFLAKEEQPEQDIIILFTDAEEVGLNGANLFVKAHPWAANVGLVLNFEARGSAGPSPMILEVNGGNSKLIEHFAKADISNPFANSLTYSVYKLLPNKTDSTIFREEADIPSYFFAFIDDHFNYHTALDTTENLDPNSLYQQGEYALALLNYFSASPLTDITSEEDHVYFNFPFLGMVHFSVNVVLFFIAFCLISVFLLTYRGIQKNKFRLKSIIQSFFFALASLFFAFLIGFYGWKLILNLYPDYNLILQGFPYNGLSYGIAFVCLICALFLRFYHGISLNWSLMSLMPVSILLWTILSLLAYLYLPGASYFIIFAFCGVLMMSSLLFLKINSQLLYFLLSLPILFLAIPFIYFLPVGLGMSAIFTSCVLVVLILLLISPLLYNFNGLKGVSFLLFCTSLFFFGKAHLNAGFSSSQPRPSSLVYCQDEEENTSYWASYDQELSDWNAAYFKEESTPKLQPNFESKYATRFAHMAPTEKISLTSSTVEVQKIKQTEEQQTFVLNLKPERKVNRYEIFFNKPILFTDVKVNAKAVSLNLKEKRFPKNTRFLNYYVANQEPLAIEFTVHTKEAFELEVFESAYDLIAHPTLQVAGRPSDEIPMPFVLNDATIVTYRIPFL